MKLGELANIRKGVKIPNKLLLPVKPLKTSVYSVVSSSIFEGGNSRFVIEKELKKNVIYSKNDLLEYGDYFLFIDKERKCRIFRHTEISGVHLPTDEIVVISGSLSVLENFLGYENNKRYLCQEVEKGISNGLKLFDLISDITINTDNIKELYDANEAEQIGIRKPIDRADMPFNLIQKPLTLDKIIKRIEHGELLLDTEFQRRPGLWDIPTKSRLIEAMIVRLPIPAFYFDGSDDDKWLVIDGLQRISTVNSFIKNEFELKELDYLTELEGKTFETLERSFQRNIEEYEIYAYIIQKGTHPAVKYKIFKNINTSALTLEPQEIRHAITPGKLADLLKATANTDTFKNHVPISDRMRDRMYDREIVLRFIALQEYRLQYSPTMVDFLDESMRNLCDIPIHRVESHTTKLKTVIENIIETFGEPPYSRSYFGDTKIYKHNNVLFELLTYAFSKNSHLIQKKELTKTKFIEFFKHQSSTFWETEIAYSKEGLTNRFESIERLIKDI